MGAIFGLAFHHYHDIISRGTIQGVVRTLFRGNEKQGPHAAGVAIVREKEITIHKDGVTAKAYPETAGYKAAINKGTTSDQTNPLLSIIGSAREATVGGPEDNSNNQPMAVGNRIIGVCEGSVRNHRRLMAELLIKYAAGGKQKLFDRTSSTDVEALFQMMYYDTHMGHCDQFGRQTSVKIDYKRAIQDACGRVQGSFAGAMVSAANPYLLFLYRTVNPLKVFIFDKPGVTVFSSSEQAMRLAVQGMGWSTPASVEFARFSGIGINLHSNAFDQFEIIPEMNSAHTGGSL